MTGWQKRPLGLSSRENIEENKGPSMIRLYVCNNQPRNWLPSWGSHTHHIGLFTIRYIQNLVIVKTIARGFETLFSRWISNNCENTISLKYVIRTIQRKQCVILLPIEKSKIFYDICHRYHRCLRLVQRITVCIWQHIRNKITYKALQAIGIRGDLTVRV